MTTTVVICAYTLERFEALTEAVASSLRQSPPPDEVLVVIDHNDELRSRASAELAGVRVLENRYEKGLSGARNTGVREARGDVIVFLDDDARVEPGWLAALLGAFADDAVAGAGGWILPDWQGRSAAWFPATYYWIIGCSYDGLPESGAAVRNPIGASMALRRRVFDEVGGFTSGIGRVGKVPLGCEETELCIRYTTKHSDERFVLVREAVAYHLVPPSRLTWSYFRARCYAEGLSKAAVSSLVGSEAGLSSERAHLTRAIPAELLATIAMVPRRPKTAAVRATLLVAGALVAAVGLLRGRIALRRTPLRSGANVLLDEPEGGDGGEQLPSVTRPAG